MKKLASIITTALYSLSIFAGTAAMIPVRVVAHDGEDHSNEVAAAEADDKKTEAAKGPAYKYVAQPGDSYSLLARKAVQTYGIKNKIKLSLAKTIAAETWLTQAAHSPELNEKQSVEIQESVIKQNVEKAQKLSAADEAAWAVYTQGVNFNTSAVGQSR
ncbi:hypothetical protein EKI60_03110 [Candidatus Saccharibacteria bacterium]|nr:MAG: hypothetical protein EKI60_03110 [Candidatus Saccharibacteria bacterium]